MAIKDIKDKITSARKQSSGLENEGFRLVANKTIAKGSSSWIDEQGRLHMKEIVPTGAPGFVQQALAPSMTGTKTELEYAHNTKVYEREMETPGTNGVIKEREVIIEQSPSIGGGEVSPAAYGPAGDVSYAPAGSLPVSAPAEPQGPSALQVLKNFVDVQANYLKWTIAGLIIVAVAVGILYGKVFA